MCFGEGAGNGPGEEVQHGETLGGDDGKVGNGVEQPAGLDDGHVVGQRARRVSGKEEGEGPRGKGGAIFLIQHPMLVQGFRLSWTWITPPRHDVWLYSAVAAVQ